MTRAARQRSAGFTMVELMVTVAILGTLAAFMVTGFKSEPVNDGTRKISTVIAEARRRAISAGPLRADVAAAGQRHRAEVIFSNERGAGVARIYVAVEDSPPATTVHWDQVGGQSLPSRAAIYAIGSSPAIDAGSTVPPALGSGTVRKRFYADGTCDAMTVYLDKLGSSNPYERYRVFVMPLTCTPGMVKGW